MGNSFRQQPGPTLYGENKTPVSEDILEVGLLVAFGMIAFSFALIIIGIRGWERLWATLRVFVALWVGTVILVSNFGYGWYTDKICTKTQYKNYIFPPNIEQEIEADIGIYIGLRAVNITLYETSCHSGYESPFPDEEIDYNEQYSWANPWAQGRFGFGRYAGRLSQEFRATQFRGTPLPIQWIAEYFTIDGEKLRWARKFRQAGWYTHIFLWLSFATYLMGMLLYIFVIRHGALFTIFTGLIMVLACFAFGIIIINDPEFKIPFQDGVLEPHFGWSWYLVLFTGLATLGLGILIYVLDIVKPEWTAIMFHHSLSHDDEFFQSEEEVEELGLEEYGVGEAGFRRGRSSRGRTRRGLKKRSTVRSTGIRRSRRSRAGGDAEEEIQLQEVSAKLE